MTTYFKLRLKELDLKQFNKEEPIFFWIEKFLHLLYHAKDTTEGNSLYDARATEVRMLWLSITILQFQSPLVDKFKNEPEPIVESSYFGVADIHYTFEDGEE